MVGFLNCRSLVSPPVCSLGGSPTISKEMLQDLRSTLRDSMCFIDTECYPQLGSELYVLNKFVYKAHSQYRREKFLVALNKVKRCLARWREVDVRNFIGRIADMMPSDHELLFPARIRLPSRQLVEHSLTRLLGVAYLLVQTSNYCTEAYHHILQLLGKGLFVPNMLLYAASVSRIWVLSYSGLKSMCHTYSVLRPWTEVLSATQVPWLPDGVSLPASLDDLPKGLSVPAHSQRQTEKAGDISVGDLMKLFNDVTSEEEMEGREQSHALLEEEGAQVPVYMEAPVSRHHFASQDTGVPIKRKLQVHADSDCPSAKGVALHGSSSKAMPSLELFPGGEDGSKENKRNREKVGLYPAFTPKKHDGKHSHEEIKVKKKKSNRDIVDKSEDSLAPYKDNGRMFSGQSKVKSGVKDSCYAFPPHVSDIERHLREMLTSKMSVKHLWCDLRKHKGVFSIGGKQYKVDKLSLKNSLLPLLAKCNKLPRSLHGHWLPVTASAVGEILEACLNGNTLPHTQHAHLAEQMGRLSQCVEKSTQAK